MGVLGANDFFNIIRKCSDVKNLEVDIYMDMYTTNFAIEDYCNYFKNRLSNDLNQLKISCDLARNFVDIYLKSKKY